MRPLDKKELLELKRNYFTPAQKTLCKKFEQNSGQFDFIVNGKKYLFKHDGSKAHTDFEESKLKYNSGTMHKGNNVRSMDKHHKFNHNEYKVHKSIDKKNK
tara:strand:- start:113 stop:415 length:303 start_codon:yes stop_codon:yes gene_type:complete